jgi:transcription termination/antitermination protein NusG
MIDNTAQEDDWQNSGSSCNSTDGEVKWFAIHVRMRYEKFVTEMLREKGFETFAPLYRHRRRYGNCVKESQLPVFPGYTFCRLNPCNRLPVLITPGVIKLLGTGRIPRPVDDGEISSLKRAAAANIEMTPCTYLKSGQTGRISRGPLAGIEGIVVQHKRSLRLVLSVTLLQRSVLLEIDSANVNACANSPQSAPPVIADAEFTDYSARGWSF